MEGHTFFKLFLKLYERLVTENLPRVKLYAVTYTEGMYLLHPKYRKRFKYKHRIFSDFMLN